LRKSSKDIWICVEIFGNLQAEFENCRRNWTFKTGSDCFLLNAHCYFTFFLRLKSAGIVLSKMTISSQSDHSSIYKTSSLYSSSKSRSERPETCAIPVMPGLMVSSLRWYSRYLFTSRSWCGRGPTRLISPLSTLNNCGSSSNESFSIARPTRVLRGSFLFYIEGPCEHSAAL